MATMTIDEWQKSTNPNKHTWTFINEYYFEHDERFWASPKWIEEHEYPGYYWFKCPNGQTLKIKNSQLQRKQQRCYHSDCICYMRAVVKKYTQHAYMNAEFDLEHILTHHVGDLFRLPLYGPDERNSQNFMK